MGLVNMSTPLLLKSDSVIATTSIVKQHKWAFDHLHCFILIFSSQMMLLKLNKEGPFKKEVFRAPGHAQSMRKLVHFLQQVGKMVSSKTSITIYVTLIDHPQGRLVNIQNYSLSTIASVIKKFLRKVSPQ